MPRRHRHVQMKAHLDGKLADAGAVAEDEGKYVDVLLQQTAISVESVRSAIKKTDEAERVSAASLVAGSACPLATERSPHRQLTPPFVFALPNRRRRSLRLH